MPVSPEDLVSLLAIITGEQNYQVTLNSNRVKGGLMTGLGATVGGVCAGPVGLLVGGLVGGSLAAWKGKSTSIPLDQYLMDINKEQRQEMFGYMKYLIDECKVQNFVGLNAKVATDPELKRRFLDVLLCYLKVELKLNVRVS